MELTPNPPPPNRLYIAELGSLPAGTSFRETYFLKDVKKSQESGISPAPELVLSDKSGATRALWRPAGSGSLTPAAASGLEPGQFVQVRGSVGGPGSPRLLIDALMPVETAGLDLSEFLPASYRDTGELMGYLEYFVAEVRDPDYERLLESFFTDPEFRRRFSLTPGDLRTHHAYLGGLLEHTVSVATLCQHVCVQHPRLDADLLVTAALLHDVGKVEQFTFAGRIESSREGSLLGHVIIGQEMIRERVRSQGGMPPEKETRLLHAHISHHGELEWGAPKRPQSAEALVLHHIDNLDARVKGFLEVVRGSGEVSWPELTNFFRRPLDEPRAADRER